MRGRNMNWVALGGNRQMARPGFAGIPFGFGAVCALAAGLFSLQNDVARHKFAPAGAQWCAGVGFHVDEGAATLTASAVKMS